VRDGRRGGLADRLHLGRGMVVPLILLGAATKLAFALALTHRTQAWWLPGGTTIAVGGAVALHDPTRALGLGTLALGVNALAIARLLRARAR
jgi:hypothetical protein